MPDNTIEALRVLQVGVEGTAATGTLTMATQPTAGDTVVIGAITYTFVASGASTAGQVNVGADAAAAQTNLIAAVNGTDGWNSKNPDASLSTFVANVATVTARVPGAAGNGVVTTETFTAVGNVFNAAALGGVAATVTLTVDTQPTAGDTMTIGARTYTFVLANPSENQISRGSSLATAKTNIIAAINGTDGINTAHPTVTAAAFVSNDAVITARTAGTVGNSIASTETFTAGTNVFSAATLTGGTGVQGAAAHGTAVAATARLAVEQLDWGDDDENVYRARVANGLLMRNRSRGVAVQHGTRFSLPDQAAIWEQLPLWFGMLIDGDPSITVSGGIYTWTFTSNPAENPDLVSITLERKFDTGLGTSISERAPYCMLSEFGMSFAVNEQIHMSGAGFARKFESMVGGVTAGLTLPSFEVGVSALSKIYVDNAWADLGTTMLSEQVIGWDLSINPGNFPRHTAEGRTDLSFTKHQLNGDERSLGLELTCLLDPATYQAEQIKANTGALRAVRIRVDGSNGRYMNVDMLMQHAKAGLWAPGADQGQDTVTFTLEEGTDYTNFIRVTLALPSVAVMA